MRKLIFIILIGICSTAKAQIPVEIFAGNERTTVDIMFFKYFKNKHGENSRWLFFNRNRASVDYRITKTTFLPQFGFTEAISYNHEKLKGFAPVIVGQVLSWGVYPKAGIQYAHINKNMTIFTWLVCGILEKPDLDYFLLFRYTPKLTEKANLFTQVESVNAFPTVSTANFSFTQRLRLGIQLKTYQFGAGTDFNQTGNTKFTKIYTIGGFIRHEF
ncbi:MAG: hypothetical protein QM534_01025 [Sediminibacterium sp.]|nr:hypothetical protein [Sediminibacterium sp.]